MQKFERTMGIITIVAIILKFFHFEGTGFLLTLSLFALSVFYLIFSAPLFNKLKLKRDAKSEIKQKSNTKRIIGSIFLGFSLSLIVIGVLFKLQIWEGAAAQLYFGLTTLAIIFIVVVIMYLGNKDEFYLSIIKRILIIGSIKFNFLPHSNQYSCRYLS